MTRIGCLWAPGVHGRGAAADQLLELALAHSPLVEDAAPGLAYVEVAGLRPLYGDEPALGGRLVAGAAERGLAVRVGIAGSRIAARAATRHGDGVRVVAPGRDAECVADAPLALLGMPDELLARLHRWGLTTCGELARLPAAALFERLGTPGLALQRRARGEDPRPLRRYAPPLRWEASLALEPPGDTLERVGAGLAELAERLAARLERRGLHADRLEWRCALAGGTVASGALTPAVPLHTAAEMRPLLAAALAARAPRGAVEGLTLAIQPVRVPPGQGSLTEQPRPHPRLVAEVVARLGALVGDAQIGVPALLDTHRPDALRLRPFEPDRATPPPAPRASDAPRAARDGGGARGVPAVALRRLRPPCPAAVTLAGGRPEHLRAAALAGRIVGSAGPWRASGEWWGQAWRRDEWDVELADGTLCRLTHDGSTWFLDAIYD